MSNCYVRSDPADPKSPKICTKGFPYPIMDETLIVFPLQSEDERKKYVDQSEENISQSSEEKMDYIDKCKVNYVKIKAILDALAYVQVKKLRSNEPFPLEYKLEQLLKATKMTHLNYIDAIRTSIRKPTVFYRRSSNDIMVNPYNKDI